MLTLLPSVLLAAAAAVVAPPGVSATSTHWWCGTTRASASSSCSKSCPSGYGCAYGEVCFSGIYDCANAIDNAGWVASSVETNGGSDAESNASSRYCGRNYDDASARCGSPCPSGGGCPQGEACFLDTACGKDDKNDAGFTILDSVVGGAGGSGGGPDSGAGDSFLDAILGDAAGSGGGGESPWGSTLSFDSPGSSSSSFSSNPGSSSSWSSSSSSSSFVSESSIAGLTGTAAVEQTFLQMKDAIDDRLFLYETPQFQWIPSTVYRFDGFFDGMRIMHTQGVAGNKIYLGGDCDHCHMYGLVNVAAFLAQAMKETIRYDACDENSWDRVGAEEMYPISNSCGQLGQSYQDYHCSEEDKHMECEVDPQMTITAVTNAKWWGAPGPLKCGPKSLYPQTGYWDYLFTCDNKWADPPLVCDAYEGQIGGAANNDRPYPNAGGRTDVEGCCWWGRGVIQTSGVCNFGKLNYFLGKRAADEGRESRYPNIDFCRDPEAICSSEEHKELKWIAGFFYWISDVQQYDDGGWNYINELHKFVESGMVGDEFINAVSGIVNRGCHNPPCGTGELDGGPERAKNFFDVIAEMEFSFVDVAPHPIPTPPPANRPISGIQVLSAEETLSIAAEPQTVVQYSCMDGYQFDDSDPSIDISFDYEIHNGIDVSVGDALRDLKQSMLAEIASRLGCDKRRTLQAAGSSDDGFDNIIALWSNANDLPDPDASGCLVDVETNNPTTCTPISGGFTVYVKPETANSSLEETSNTLKSIVRTGMAAGLYETAAVDKAIYIGKRGDYSDASASAPINAQTVGPDDETNGGLKIAIYALACACLLLLFLLCFAWGNNRKKRLRERRLHDEEMAFSKFMIEKDDHSMDMAPPANDAYLPESHRGLSGSTYIKSGRQMFESDENEEVHQRAQPTSRGSSLDRRYRNSQSRRGSFEGGEGGEVHIRSRSSSRGSSLDRTEQHTGTTFESDAGERVPQPPPYPRSSSRGSSLDRQERNPGFAAAAATFSQQNQVAPNEPEQERFTAPSESSSDDSSVESTSSDFSSSKSSSSSSEDETWDHTEQQIPVEPRTSSMPTLNVNPPPTNGFGESVQSNASSAKEERQKRMAQARARAARRRLS